MTDNNKILQLCELTGIQTTYRDHRNEPHSIAVESLRALLDARGFDTENGAETDAAIAKLRNEAGEFRVPPVLVLQKHESVSVPLQVPLDALDDKIAWRLSLEDGRQLRGDLVPGHCIESKNRHFAQCTLKIEHAPDHGYHWLVLTPVRAGMQECRTRLIVVPDLAYEDDENASKAWGVSVQLYTVKSARNWGIGDFTDLANLARGLARAGADFVGVNPLHALFPSNPEHASPYSPASRAFINYLYIDVEAVPEYAVCAAAREKVSSEYFQSRLGALRECTHVDYSGVAFLKLVILRQLFETFTSRELSRDTERAGLFNDFCEAGGAALEQLCLFYALYAHHRKASRNGGWRNWPEAYRDPHSEAVAKFAESNQHTVRFYMYLQWLADEQLGAAQAAALEAGMRTGIYRDLAVGIDSDGADNWRNQALYCARASVGAPPDAIALQGQDWGLPPMEPSRMQAEGYATFIEDLRDNMLHCGALRLDHAMQLMRLWWTPAGRPSSEGAYVRYPLEDLLGIVALESHRNQCRIIGEDLGVVPEEIREALPRRHIWSYKVVLFEKDHEGQLIPPEDYAPHAMATLTTHDLPTLPEFWRGSDLRLREKLALFPNIEIKERSWNERSEDRQAFVEALRKARLYPEDLPERADDIDHLPESLLLALESFLASSASRMVCAQIEDWLGIEDPVNVPGTSTEYPNWRRRLTSDLERILDSALLAKHAAALDRSHPVKPKPF